MTRATVRPVASPARSLLTTALAALLAVAGPARADELRLHDGRVLVGKVQKKAGTLEVTTREGVIVVAEQDVLERIPEEVLRQRLLAAARGADDTTFAHLQLAIQARASGLEPEMWRHLDRALARLDAGEVGQGLRRRLAEFLAELEPEVLPRRFRAASTKVRVRQLLDGMHASTGAGRAAAIEELLVREPNADQDLRTEARRNGNPRQRIAALQALQRRPLAGNDRFVLRTAILDGNEQVRETAVAIARPAVAAADIEYMATGLGHGNPKVRIRTAEALGGLGHADAVRYLVLAGPTAAAGLAAGSSDGVRGHIAIVQQQAYVRDYDVEVASAAFIADPRVDVLQSGAVLDVTVLGVVEERIIVRAYRQALQKLTRRDPGDDPRTWATWLATTPPATPAPQTPGR